MGRCGLICALVLVIGSCGSSNKLSSVPPSGAYEFVVTSNVTGGITLIEANLSANGNQSSGSGTTQVQILSFEKKNWYINGICPGNTPGQNSVTAALASSNVNLTFDEGGNSLAGAGIITGTEISANYSVTGSSCADLPGTILYPPGTDQGGIVGNQVPSLAGTFSGTLNLPNGTDDAALTLNENPDHSLTVNAVLTGSVDNGTFSLTGTVVGNIFLGSGTVSGSPLTLFGYYDRAGTYTKTPNSLLVFNYGTLSSAGLLLGQ